MRVSTVALLLALQPQKAASFVGVPGGALRPSPSHVRHDAGTGTGCTATCSRIGADSSSTGPGGGGFGVVGRSATATAAVPARPSTTRVRSQDSPAAEEDNGAAAADEEKDAFAKRLDSLKASDLLGGGGDSLGGGGDLLGRGGGGNVATAVEGAVADLGEPGKLVREAVKPFQEEMDRIEAEFEKNVRDTTDDMERRLEEMMKKIDEEN